MQIAIHGNPFKLGEWWRDDREVIPTLDERTRVGLMCLIQWARVTIDFKRGVRILDILGNVIPEIVVDVDLTVGDSEEETDEGGDLGSPEVSEIHPVQPNCFEIARVEESRSTKTGTLFRMADKELTARIQLEARTVKGRRIWVVSHDWTRAVMLDETVPVEPQQVHGHGQDKREIHKFKRADSNTLEITLDGLAVESMIVAERWP